jgi:hypothetical protein
MDLTLKDMTKAQVEPITEAGQDDALLQDDGAGKSFIPVNLPSGTLRVYFSPASTAGFEEDCIRLNRMGEDNKFHPGPEIPIRLLGEVFQAIQDVVRLCAYAQGVKDLGEPTHWKISAELPKMPE